MLSLGEGTFGCVHVSPSDATVARKTYKDLEDGVCLSLVKDAAVMDMFQAEPGIMQMRGLKPADAHARDSKFVLEMDRYACDLSVYWKTLTGLRLHSLPRLRDVVWKMLLSVARCHTLSVVHRDVKPANFVVRGGDVAGVGGEEWRDLEVCLTDFGISALLGQGGGEDDEAAAEGREGGGDGSATTWVVTLWYRAPELLLGGKRHGLVADVWSVGMIMAQMSRGGVPLVSHNEDTAFSHSLFQILGTPTEEHWPGVTDLPKYARRARPQGTCFAPLPVHQWCGRLLEADAQGKNLLEGMLRMNPADRLTAYEAMAHPFFAEHGYDREEVLPAAVVAVAARTDTLLRTGVLSAPVWREEVQGSRMWHNLTFDRGLALPLLQNRSLERSAVYIFRSLRPPLRTLWAARELTLHYVSLVAARGGARQSFSASQVATLMCCGLVLHQKLVHADGIDLCHAFAALRKRGEVDVDMIRRTEHTMFAELGGVTQHPTAVTALRALRRHSAWLDAALRGPRVSMVLAYAACCEDMLPLAPLDVALAVAVACTGDVRRVRLEVGAWLVDALGAWLGEDSDAAWRRAEEGAKALAAYTLGTRGEVSQLHAYFWEKRHALRRSGSTYEAWAEHALKITSASADPSLTDAISSS